MEPICPLCGTVSVSRLFAKGDAVYYDCEKCAFRFAVQATNPNLENDLDDFEPSYLQYLRSDRGDERNLQALRRWMSRFCSLDEVTSLDIGAGSGKLVRFLRRHGGNAAGIEPSRALFEHFLAGDPAFALGTLETCRLDPCAVDVVTAFDVIEHVAQPLEFLDRVAQLVKPGGLFFVSTPDVGSVPARVFGRRWHFYHAYHLSYFSPETLAAVARPYGFELLDMRHRGRLRSVGYIVRYAFEVIGKRAAPGWVARCDDWYLPVNLFDTMYLCFRRTASRGEAQGASEGVPGMDRVSTSRGSRLVEGRHPVRHVVTAW